jgi:hypothetical protein
MIGKEANNLVYIFIPVTTTLSYRTRPHNLTKDEI